MRLLCVHGASRCGVNEVFLAQMRAKMMSMALKELDDAHAHDAVQEALLAAFVHQDKFLHQSLLSTWLFAILKNKIRDIQREHARQNQHYIDADDSIVETMFDQDGEWHIAPKTWQDPENYASSFDFWRAFDFCMQNLPAEQAQVFLLKEYIELDTDEICVQMDISTSYFYVLMHRARLRLQACLGAQGAL